MATPVRAKPWFRKGRGWFVTLDNQQYALGVTDPAAVDAALAAVKQLLLARASATPDPLADLIPRYLDAIRHRVSDKTIVGYRNALNWFRRHFGTQTHTQLDPLALERAAAGESHWSDSHRTNVLWVCQSLVRWAGRKEFTVRRPPKESRGAECVITPELHARILVETRGDFNRLLHLLWLTGARPGEAAGLTVEGVNWETATATLKQHKTKKKGKQRVLYFSPEAMGVLTDQLKKYHTGLLFRGLKGEKLTAYKIVRRMIRLSAKLGVPVICYGYRHSYATRLLEGGASDSDVAALLGHAGTGMLHKNYAHVVDNAKRLSGVAARFDEAKKAG